MIDFSSEYFKIHSPSFLEVFRFTFSAFMTTPLFWKIFSYDVYRSRKHMPAFQKVLFTFTFNKAPINHFPQRVGVFHGLSSFGLIGGLAISHTPSSVFRAFKRPLTHKLRIYCGDTLQIFAHSAAVTT
jgi:hypothetical protein